MTYYKILFSLGAIHKQLVTSIFFLMIFFNVSSSYYGVKHYAIIFVMVDRKKKAQAIKLFCSIIMYMYITICIHHIIISAHIRMAL